DADIRPDIRYLRFGTSLVPKKHLLRSITTPLGTYTLTYMDPDPLLGSRLKSIGYCAGGHCLQPLEFDWEGGGYHWESAPGYALPVNIANEDGHPSGAQF